MKARTYGIAGMVALFEIIGMSMAINKIDVTETVKTDFSQKYPEARQVEWEMEEADEYEAEFKLKGVEMSANFKKDGTWLGTETEIDEDDLPKVVKDGITSNFPGYDIEEAELSEKPDGVLVYEVEMENEKEDIELKAVFSLNGKIIKKEIGEEEGDKVEDDN